MWMPFTYLSTVLMIKLSLSKRRWNKRIWTHDFLLCSSMLYLLSHQVTSISVENDFIALKREWKNGIASLRAFFHLSGNGYALFSPAVDFDSDAMRSDGPTFQLDIPVIVITVLNVQPAIKNWFDLDRNSHCTVFLSSRSPASGFPL